MIKRIKWHNHKVLGNLELDFLKNDGTPYNTIVLAGENGTGKTTILDTLATFLNRASFAPFENIEYTVGDVMFSLSRTTDRDAEFGFHNRTNKNDVAVTNVRTNINNNPGKIDGDEDDIRHYGVAYSRARSGFKVDPIKSSTAEQLDSDKYEIDNRDNFTSIAQLLIDVDTDDSRLLKKILKEHKDGQYSYKEFEKISKMSRFKKAFDEFFGVMKFEDIETANGTIRINFKKYDKSIELEHLSTGEKQIVFRGAQLLKNSGNMSGGVVLVDEPELSMHPKWQAKILKYYRDLFTKNGKQETQMIFATHSSGVICEAMEHLDDIKVIVLKCDDKGVVSSGDIETPLVLKGKTSAEINYQAFNISSTDYHNALYGYIEAEGWKDDFNKAHPKVKYIKQNKDGTTTTMHVTLSEKIRHIIHHPENKHNTYSDEDIKASIKTMREFIIGQQNIGVCKSGAVTN